jgi:hypothetical protein
MENQSPDPRPGGEAGPTGVARWLRAAMVLLSVLALGSLVVQAFAHLGDRYRVDHVSGGWIVLADAAMNGELYPPLCDDAGRLGGTRYMPLGILATAGAARITGDVILAGKLVALAGTLSLAGAMLGIMRLARVPMGIAVGFIAIVLASEPGQIALLTARQEAWPAAMQLLAVLIIAQSRSTGMVVLAAACSVLAFTTKLSAVWAPVSIGLWLLMADRRAWIVYVAAYGALAGVTLGLLHWSTQGRMLESVLGLGGAGLDASGGVGSLVLGAVARLMSSISSDAPALWALGALALGAIVRGAGQASGRGLLAIAWFVAGALLIFLFADIGVASNHLLDFAAISACLTGTLATRRNEDAPSARGASRESMIVGVVTIVLVFVLPMQLLRPSASAAKQLLRGTSNEWTTRTPLAGVVRPGAKVLFEDPSLWLGINQRPEFSDPFMLPRLFGKHPEWARPFVDRLTNHEYERVVLIRPIHEEFDHYKNIHLGEAIGRAILEHYQFEKVHAGRWIYAPKQTRVPAPDAGA